MLLNTVPVKLMDGAVVVTLVVTRVPVCTVVMLLRVLVDMLMLVASEVMLASDTVVTFDRLL